MPTLSAMIRAMDHSIPTEKSKNPINVGKDSIIDIRAGKKVLCLAFSGNSLNKYTYARAVIPSVRVKVKIGLIKYVAGFVNRN
jgi:hypothetical protein